MNESKLPTNEELKEEMSKCVKTQNMLCRALLRSYDEFSIAGVILNDRELVKQIASTMIEEDLCEVVNERSRGWDEAIEEATRFANASTKDPNSVQFYRDILYYLRTSNYIL